MSVADDGQVLGYRAVGIFTAAEYLMINDRREILPALYGEEITSFLDDGYLRFQIIDPAGDVVMQTADWQALVEKMEEIENFSNRCEESYARAMTTEELNALFDLGPLDLCPGPGRLAATPASGDMDAITHKSKGVTVAGTRGLQARKETMATLARCGPFTRLQKQIRDTRQEGRQ
jgi:hypothetical protein